MSSNKEQNIYRNLMRNFFQFQTDTLLCVHEDIIAGTIDKRAIEELMSDLVQTENQEIPVQKFFSGEDALEALVHRGILVNNQKAIPAVDNNGIFIALWSKAEILKHITSNAPDVKKDSDYESLPKIPEKTNKVDPVKPEIRVQISSAQKNNEIKKTQQILNSSSAETTSTHFPDSDYVSIKTLETLPIPMLAVDTRGEVLFYNQDWINLQQREKNSLGVKTLMRTSRDLMAKMAFDGNLEIDSVLHIPGAPEGYSLQMKSILGDNEPVARAIGYLFWIEHNPSQNSSGKKPEREKSSQTKIHPENDPADEPRKDYMGKTLIELLEMEEKKIIRWAMDEADQNQSNAAMLLGIPRQTFSYRYHKLFDLKSTDTKSRKNRRE